MTTATLNQSPVIVQTFMGAIYSSVYYAADTGSANAVVIPLAASPASYLAAVGTKWATIAKATNTSSSMTAKIGSLGAVAVTLNDGVTLPAPGQYIVGQYYEFTPNAAGTGLILLNPSDATGSFAGTLTGVSSGGTGTVNYRNLQDGKIIYTWFASALTGVSNTTACTMTGVPTSLQPVTAKQLSICVQNSSATSSGSVFITAASGTWTLGNPGVTGFTNSGNKGFTAGDQFSYSLD